MNEFEQELRANLSNEDFMQLWSRLRKFKERGGSSDEALHILEMLRAEQSADYPEDRILELLDIVTGFCAPRLRIW